jgi:hypothetical protein
LTAPVALLAGLFVVPVALLILGNRFRDRGPIARGAFWGGVIGHSSALALVVAALHLWPVMWQQDVRAIIAFWGLLAGGAGGAAIGSLRAAGRQRALRTVDSHDG